MINEIILKDSLFNFLKENSNEQEYKKGIELLTANNVKRQNTKFKKNKIEIKTVFTNEVKTDIIVEFVSSDYYNIKNVSINCSHHKTKRLCKYVICSFLYFFSNYKFDYLIEKEQSISPLLLLNHKYDNNKEGFLILKDKLVKIKISNGLIYKYLEEEKEITEDIIEKIINYQFANQENPKYFIKLKKRKLIPLNIQNEIMKFFLSISKLNEDFINISLNYEEKSDLLYIFNGFFKKVFIFKNGRVKIYPEIVPFELLDKLLKKSQVIDLETLNQIIFFESDLINKNIFLDKNNILGFNLFENPTDILFYLSMYENYLQVKVELKFKNIKIPLNNFKRIYDENIILKSNIEKEIYLLLNDLKVAEINNSFLLNEEGALKLLTDIIPEKFPFAKVYGEEKLGKFKIYRPSSSFKFKSLSIKDWLEIDVKVKYKEAEIGLPELIKSINENKKYVKISKGKYGIIPNEFIAQLKSLLENPGILFDRKVKKLKLFKLYAASNEDLALKLNLEPKIKKELNEIKEKISNFSKIKRYKLPKNISKFLRSYQKDGVRWLLFLRDYNLNGILADDMGLGKTIQALTLLNFERHNKPNLIIVPTSLLYNWENEIKKFLYDFDYLIYYGKDRDNTFERICSKEITITTYNIIRLDINKFKDIDFNYIILDEAQYIKNPTSLISKYIKKLKSKHKLSLTGTPIENNIVDLWSQFDFLHPGLFKNVKEFLKEDSSKLELLKKRLTPLILRRKKEEVLKELPPKTEITYFYEMDDEQKKLYMKVRDFYLEKIMRYYNKENKEQSKIIVIEALLRLRQICCHPKLVGEDKVDSVKFRNFKLLIENLVLKKDTKILVYSQFVKMLKIIKEWLKRKSIKFEYLDGASKNRIEIVDRFEKDSTIKIFLISLKAGGLGLNLTSSENVIIYDPWWNPAVETQAIDRTHRIGQDKKVFAYKLITKNSVEEKIIKLQNQKRNIFLKVISDNSFLKKLTKEDIEFIFSD